MSFEFHTGPNGEVLDKTYLSAARDLAKLRALTQPGNNIVSVNYLVAADKMGAHNGYVKNFATPNFGAQIYEIAIQESLPEHFELNHLDLVKVEDKQVGKDG